MQDQLVTQCKLVRPIPNGRAIAVLWIPQELAVVGAELRTDIRWAADYVWTVYGVYQTLPHMIVSLPPTPRLIAQWWYWPHG